MNGKLGQKDLASRQQRDATETLQRLQSLPRLRMDKEPSMAIMNELIREERRLRSLSGGAASRAVPAPESTAGSTRAVPADGFGGLDRTTGASRPSRRRRVPVLGTMAALLMLALIGSVVLWTRPMTVTSLWRTAVSSVKSSMMKPKGDAWLTKKQQLNLSIAAIANLYQGTDVKVVRLVSSSEEVTHQPMYLVRLRGHFMKTSQPNAPKVSANSLSFSVLGNGSKVWAVTASDGGHSQLWSYNGTLDVQIQQMAFFGRSEDWAGVYRQARATVWKTTPNWTEEGTAIKYTGEVRYIGIGRPSGSVRYLVTGGLASGGGTLPLPIDGRLQVPNLQMFDKAETISVFADANHHPERFLMHDVSQ